MVPIGVWNLFSHFYPFTRVSLFSPVIVSLQMQFFFFFFKVLLVVFSWSLYLCPAANLDEVSCHIWSLPICILERTDSYIFDSFNALYISFVLFWYCSKLSQLNWMVYICANYSPSLMNNFGLTKLREYFSWLFVYLTLLDSYYIVTVHVGCGKNKCFSFSI